MTDAEIDKIHSLLDELIQLTTGKRAIEASWRANEKGIIITYTLEQEKKPSPNEE